MTVRITLSEEQCSAAARGQFVRVDLGLYAPVPEPTVEHAATRSALVGRVGGAWRAYANVCRHRALPLDLGQRTPMSEDGRFLLCGQHGALYDLGSGKCLSGPCVGLSLFAIPVRQDDVEPTSLLLDVGDGRRPPSEDDAERTVHFGTKADERGDR
jgi:nitrite reductase/ring-hydroxylating ferredoxin subunit